MLKNILLQILNKLLFFWKQNRDLIMSPFQSVSASLKKYFSSWWRTILFVFCTIVFLYYPLGGLLIEKIDTSSSYKPRAESGRMASIDMAMHLINREVHEKIWTPSLPFMFPTYFLDNMPNFQLGLMSAVSKTVSAFNQLSITVSPIASQSLSDAAEFLQYPGNIWLFSPQNHLLPAPSSANQYKKGRKNLKIFNNELAAKRANVDRTPQNLRLILKPVLKDINTLITKNEDYIRETNDSYIDFKADDTFYFSLGKLYAYAQLLKAFGVDFKQTLVSEDIYQQWTSLLKSLDDASDLNPTIVRNGKLNSSLTPNHLVTINYFAARAQTKLKTVIQKLEHSSDKKQ